MRTGRAVTVDGFDYEVDSYSIVNGEHTEDFALAGGSVVLRGRVGDAAVTATVSAANLTQALGQALLLLLHAEPAPGVGRLAITGYIDGEAGTFMEIDRHDG